MKVFSFDAETDRLWGNPFAVAAIVYEKKPLSGAQLQAKYGLGVTPPAENPSDFHWVETARFMARLEDSVVRNEWVKENVLPALGSVAPTHETYGSMLADFAKFYMTHKADADCICHMGYIVEAHLLREMRRLGGIGDWDAPYPLLDISGHLAAVGEDPTSVDAYAKKHGLEISDYGTTHNPLYDCEVAARCYIHLMSKNQ